MQLHWKKISETDRKIVDFCVQSIEQSGYFLIPVPEIAKRLNVPEEQAGKVLSMLKELEPQGIFASGLEECLLIQVQGMDEEEILSEMIKHHLQNIAEGKISTISRALKLSSAEVQSNDYYIHMMETAQDQELKSYFENKLRRARFIINAVEQRRETLTAITREILKRQEPYFLGTGQLKPMTLEEIADALEIHKSTVSRAIRDKYLRAPSGCFLFRSLFTTGIPSGDGNGDVSRNAVKAKLKELVAAEDKKKPWSDEQLAGLLQDAGMPISRRTVAKYRMELGIGGAFQRKDG